MFKKWYVSFVSKLSYLMWRLRKNFVGETKEEPSCPHGCGIPLKYHAWSDCGSTQAALKTMSKPATAKAKAFYDSVGRKMHEEKPDPLHGADCFSSRYKGPGGPGCAD